MRAKPLLSGAMKGIHNQVGDAFWQAEVNLLERLFFERRFYARDYSCSERR
jgi:hypothetical protein